MRSVLCPSCGARMREGRPRCFRCGAPLDLADVAPARTISIVTLAIGLTAVLSIVAIVALTTPNSSAPAENPPAPGVPPPAVTPTSAPVPSRPLANRSVLAASYEAVSAATEAYRRGDYEAALGRFQAVLEKDPNDADALNAAGQLLARLGRLEEAVPLLRRAVALKPDKWAYHFNLAHAHGELKEWVSSIEQYRAAVRLAPNDYATRFNLAQALHKNGDEPAAIDEYRRAMALSGGDPDGYFALALSLERAGQRQQAADAYRKYLELKPSAPEADKIHEKIASLAEPPPVPGPGSKP